MQQPKWLLAVVTTVLLAALASTTNADEEAVDSHARTLSARDAKELISRRGLKLVVFHDLTELTPEVAAQLAMFDGWLRLVNVQSIDVATAEALAKHKGGLVLGLTKLPDDVARALSRHAGRLDIDGPIGEDRTLDSLTSAELAEKLTASVDYVGLNVKHLSPDVEAIFAAFKGELNLQGLTTLANAQLARKLVESDKADGIGGTMYDLRDLKSLSPEVAAELAAVESGIDLAGLAQLDVAVARSLAKVVGFLSLDGLTELPDDVAAELGKHNGELRLKSVRKLTDGACEGLSSHVGDLWLSNLKDVSERGVIALAKSRGKINLGVESLTDPAAHALASRREHDGGWLPNLTDVSADAAEVLLRSKLVCSDAVKKCVAANTVDPLFTFNTQVTAARFSGKGDLFAVGCFDGSVFVGDTATRKKAFYIDVAGHPNYITGLRFLGEGSALLATATAMMNGAAWLINVNNERVVRFLEGGAVQCMAVDGRERRFVLVRQGHRRCDIDVFPLPTTDAEPEITRRVESETFSSVGFSRDGNAVIGVGRTKAYVWNLNNRGEQEFPLAKGGGASASCVADGGQLLACGSATGAVMAIPITNANALDAAKSVVLKGLEGKVNAVAVSQDATLVAAGDDKNRVVVWRVADQAVVKRSGRLAGAVRSLSFAPSTKVLIVGAGDLNKEDVSGALYLVDF